MQRTSAGKQKWKLKQICTNEARSTTRWINGYSWSLNVKWCRAARTWRKQHHLKKNSGEEETRLKLKQHTSMDQEPYPNQEDGCTKGLDGSRYQLRGILDGELEGNPWRTTTRRWSAAELMIWRRIAHDKGGVWWRWRVEVVLWCGRWLEEMKEKISHVCSQINRNVEWSQH